MVKAVSAIELAKEVSANTGAFRYYLRKNWGERQKYQRWLFTRAQADKIKSVYLSSSKYGAKQMIRHQNSAIQNYIQLRLKLHNDKKLEIPTIKNI